ncbi:MAG: hypothetical protein LBG52_07655 [Candidatus Peribacteria bacterium]|nr:hypothetical protein [Candidatus Peribacteria bacterium]
MKASLELQGWDKCKQEQKAQALSEVSSSESPDAATVIESERSVVNDLKTDIAGMKQELSQQLTDQLNELYTLMAQQAQQLASACQTNGEEIVSTPVDLNAQRAAEIQAQIQQLQAEMENLY